MLPLLNLMDLNHLNEEKKIQKNLKSFEFPKSFNTFQEKRNKTAPLSEGSNATIRDSLNEEVINHSTEKVRSRIEEKKNPAFSSSNLEPYFKSEFPFDVKFESENLDRLFFLAEENFKKNQFQEALNFLNQLVLKKDRNPLTYHMLGTIYYDQGKFNRSISMFKRALEIDPGFTDSSVGLSILLNDLGLYDEGKEVFEKAKSLIKETKQEKENQSINAKLSMKHDELGNLYFQYKRYDEALSQYFKALSLNPLKLEVHLSVVDCYLFLGKNDEAVFELKDLCKEMPDFHKARIVLGKIYYDQGHFSQAISEWNEVLKKDPHNIQVKLLLKKLGKGL